MQIPKPEKRGRKPPRPIRRKRPKKRRQPFALAMHKWYEEVADEIWSVIIRSYSPLCVRCRMRPTHDAMHLVSRSYRQTRWRLDNGLPGCRYCHEVMGRDQHEHVRIVEREVGREKWEELNFAKGLRVKVDPAMAGAALSVELRRRGLTMPRLPPPPDLPQRIAR